MKRILVHEDTYDKFQEIVEREGSDASQVLGRLIQDTESAKQTPHKIDIVDWRKAVTKA